MAGQNEQERHDRWKALGIRTDIPHPARVYDYLLGGKDNFGVDREAAEMSLKISPEVLDSARANRKFLVRSVRFLRDNGIRQFLDVGTGLPTSPNTYEVAQSGHPDARVVYIDNDPVVFLHAESLMADNETTTVVRADLRDADEVLATAGKLLDFAKPVGLLFVACLHNIPDHDDPAGIVARYLTALAPGSYLVISHVTDEFAPERMHAITAEYAGNVNFTASNIGSLSQEVQKNDTKAKVTLSTTDPGVRLVLTAIMKAVPPGTNQVAKPTGQVTFVIDGVTRGTVDLVDNVAKLVLPNGLSLGTHKIVVQYTGDGNNFASTTTIFVSIGGR